MKIKKIQFLFTCMQWANFAAVYSIASEFLFISQYISKNQLNLQLINKLQRIPASPETVFWQCILTQLVLMILIKIRNGLELSRKQKNWLLLLEMLVATCVLLALRINYNGIFLLVFVDFILTNDNLASMFRYRFWIIVGVIIVFIFSLSSYSFLGNILNMPSINTYIECLPEKDGSLIYFINVLLNSTNLIIFFGICLEYAISISNREKEVLEKLSVVSKSNQELRNYADLSGKIATDRERKRIARDIHDTVGHALTGISAGIDAVLVLIDLNPEAAKKQLHEISQAVKKGLTDIRRVLNQMRPEALSNYTLEASLRKMLVEYGQLSHLKIDFSYHWGEAEFDKPTELVIFRVIEESVTNALRHGHAKKISIVCDTENDNFRIEIANDGKTPEKIKPGYGITQMKERIAIINGKIRIKTKPKFTVAMTFPKKEHL